MKKFNNLEEYFKKNKYLIALDLDGTLLDDEKNISSNSIEYIKSLISYGNKIVLSSGRSDTNLLQFYEKLNLDTPIISYNGSKITFPNTKRKDISYTINKKVILKFLSHYKEDFVNIFGESNTCAYFFKEYKLFENFFASGNKDIIYGSFINNVKSDLFSLIVQSLDTSRNEEMDKYLKSISRKYGLRFWYDFPVFGEFYQVGVNKGSSLKKVASILKIKKENIIAFGDGNNDIEMLSLASYSYAMKNGSELLKKHSKNVTKYTNNEDGVILSLQELFSSLSN